MADYEQSALYSGGTYLPGADVLGDDAAGLIRQGNGALGGCGSPLCLFACEIENGEAAALRIPPMPGLRAVRLSVLLSSTAFASVEVTLDLSDDTGALFATQTMTAADKEVTETILEWDRPQDGEMLLEISGTDGTKGHLVVGLFPVPFATSESGMEGDGYAAQARADEDRGLSVRAMNILSAQAYSADARPQVYWTAVDPGGMPRRAGGKQILAAQVPVLSSGKKIGIAVQAAGDPDPVLRMYVGSQVVELDGWPMAQGELVEGETAAIVPAGWLTVDVETTLGGGESLTVYSVAIFEVP